MSFLEIVFTGAGLAMDAAAVSMTNGMICSRNAGKNLYIAMPLFFGGFQTLMPLLGYFTGGLFAAIIMKLSGILVFVILGLIGFNMIRESRKRPEDTEDVRTITYRLLFFQAIATSIDAFAVGIGLRTADVDVFGAAACIGVVTACITAVSVIIGRKSGDMLGPGAEMLGGMILIVIGLRSLI